MIDLKKTPKLRPLDQSWMYELKIADPDDSRILTQRHKAVEFGLTRRLSAAPHPDYPGIFVINSYAAFATPPAGPPCLEDAAALHPNYNRFLLSTTPIGIVAITSRLGYPDRGSVRVPPPSSSRPWTEIHHYDYEDTIGDDELTVLHLARLAMFKGDPMAELPREVAEKHFRQLIARTSFEISE